MAMQDHGGGAGVQVQHPASTPPWPVERSRAGSTSSSVLSGPPSGLWPESICQQRTPNKVPGSSEQALEITATQDAPDTENAMADVNMEESVNGRFSIISDHPPLSTRTSEGPSYFSSVPFAVSTLPSDSSSRLPQDLSGWTSFPPQALPKFDPFDPTKSRNVSSIKGLRDVEELTDEHIKQSTALREWMIQTEADRKLLDIIEADHKNVDLLEIYRRISVQAPDRYTRTYAKHKAQDFKETLLPARKKDAEKDRALAAAAENTYAAFVDVRTYEKHASLRHYHEETSCRKQPEREPSRAELLLGPAAASPRHSATPDLPTDVNLYYVGAPPKLVRMPFNEAVAAGLEGGGGNTSNPGGGAREPGGSGEKEEEKSSKSSPPGPDPAISWSPWWQTHVPDWFHALDAGGLGLGLGLEWDADADAASRYRGLLNLIDQLEKAMQVQGLREMARKPAWDKHWHEPHDKWRPHTKRQRHGGWWKCRDGPDAPAAERGCRVCHDDGNNGEGKGKGNGKGKEIPKPVLDPRKLYQRVMNAIARAMAAVAERDREIVLARMRRDGVEEDDGLWIGDLRRSGGVC
ncbi:hypothetical protein F4779DRAFT_358729 [Xylariaceae sp. FL0662B]|nr:hypothetical protein F4779DRAFT_358729 [Xylariaceae sp. FL0662B]